MAIRQKPSGDLVSQVRHLLAADEDGEWRVGRYGFWWTVTPRGAETPAQGWKIHVSATPASSADVLAGAVPVLRRHRTPFKFARDLDAVRWLTGRDCERALAGKFLTVYPVDDDTFTTVAAELHTAVHACAAPRILSDRRYAPGSPVHYRYGGFRGDGDLDSDGVYRYRLTTPEGGTVEDRREAWFDAPSWAPCPLGEDEPADGGASGKAVLLGGRYVVRGALRHSAKGGVYLATDSVSGDEVVVKHARAHTEVDASGRDARDLLRNEARALQALAGTAPVPRVHGLFDQDGDVFLAEQRLPGRPLRSWTHHHAAADPGVPLADAWPIAVELASSVSATHRAGFALRDLSPTNVVVAPDGAVHLVDLELATPFGVEARRSGTPAYQAPEHRVGGERAPATAEEDLYSLGALLFLLATGCDPLLPDDGPAHRPGGDRLATWLELVAEHGTTAAALRPLVLGLLAEAPDARWTMADVTGYLAASTGGRESGRGMLPAAPAPSPDRLLSDGIDYLLDSMTVDRPRPWPSGSFGRQTDAGNVQHGAAGVLSTLVGTLPHAPAPDAALRTVRTAADWLSRQHPPGFGEQPLPGLYFGRSGVAWALAEAALALADRSLLDAAVSTALQLPISWPNPDVAHGVAGACLAHLRLARLSGDSRLRDRADRYADALARAVREDEHGPYWRIPDGFDSMLAGKRHHGFAHGAAGIGYALLTNGRDRDFELAVRVGDALCRSAQLDADGAAWWPVGPGEPTRLPHWCSGCSGVGTFLVRLYARTGERRFADLTAAAALAVHRSRWQSSPVACHGLAGDGQFLLDAAELVDPTYHGWATDLADCLAVRHCVRDGRFLTADETGRDVVADHQVGAAGVVAFLARLRHGGPRPFMVDHVDSEVSRC